MSARAAFVFGASALALLAAIYSPAIAADATYAQTLREAATRLDHAANAKAAVPFLHVPPAPLGGKPRYSPSIDDWLQAALRATREDARKSRPEDLREIATSLRHLADGEAGVANGVQRNALEADAAAILAEPAYRVATAKPVPPPTPSIWERILQWIIDRINALFDRLASATDKAPALGTIFAVILIGSAVVLLALIGYRLASGLAARPRPEAETTGDLLPAMHDADDLRAAAVDAAKHGAFARAIALLFLAALVTLERRKGITYDPARTAGEYRRIVRRTAAALAPDFDTLARTFTNATFGNITAGEVDWQNAANASACIDRQLGAA